MGHSVSLLAGPRQPLLAIRALAGMTRIFALTPGAAIRVVALGDEVHDALHRQYGTGEWSDTGVLLTSTDMAFFARVSQGSMLAYLETDYFGGAGRQAAVLWVNGKLALGPAQMDAAAARSRAAHLWPINAALRGLGIRADPGQDEFATFGLARFRSNDAVLESALETDRPR